MSIASEYAEFYRKTDDALGDVLGIIATFHIPETHGNHFVSDDESVWLDQWLIQLRGSLRSAIALLSSPRSPKTLRFSTDMLTDDLERVSAALASSRERPPPGVMDHDQNAARSRVARSLDQARSSLRQLERAIQNARAEIHEAAVERAQSEEPPFLRFKHITANLAFLLRSYLRNLVSQVAPRNVASWPCMSSFEATGFLTAKYVATVVLEPRPSGIPLVGSLQHMPLDNPLGRLNRSATREGHEALRVEMGVSDRGIVVQVPLRTESENIEKLQKVWTAADRQLVGKQIRLNLMHQMAALGLLRPVAEEKAEPERTPIPDLDTEDPPVREALEFEYSEIVGESAGLLKALWTLDKAIPASSPVVIYGETGTGKELVARAVHEKSSRRSSPFMDINCAAIPENMIESELFGHVKGAFSGATENRLGIFRAAEGGVVFLDEIGEMPKQMQSKLLRAVDQQMVRPLGTEVSYPFDARLVAATNRDLTQMVRDGTFRKDLLYRLRHHTIHLPPLRDRLEDLPLLVNRFGQQIGDRLGTPITDLHSVIGEQLEGWDWPGNVREVRSMVLGLLETGFSELEHTDEGIPKRPIRLPREFRLSHEEAILLNRIRRCEGRGRRPTDEEKKVRRAAIEKLIANYGWTPERLANCVGVDERTVQRWIEAA